MGLNGQHIGDKYPLCSDSPKQRFLKKGAKYVLLGSSNNSAHQDNPKEWSKDPNVVRLNLRCDEDDSTKRILRRIQKKKKKKINEKRSVQGNKNKKKKKNKKKNKKNKKNKKKKKKQKRAPTTSAPTISAPTTSSPTVRLPTTDAPTTNVPVTNIPTTTTPTTAVPSTNAPTSGEACDCINCLFKQLCNANSDGKCVFQNEVELMVDAECRGKECDVDAATVVEVEPGIFYEYVPEPCVNQAFYPNAKKITKGGWYNMCADPRREVATTACCKEGDWDWIAASRSEEYWGELMTYETAASRCDQINKPLCNSPSVWNDCSLDDEYINECKHEPFYWTNDECVQKIKVDPANGKIAIVHYAGDSEYNSHRVPHLEEDSLTYFRVHWMSDFPTLANSCGGAAQSSCTDYNNMCLCEVYIEDTSVYSAMPTKEDVFKELHIGSIDPLLLNLNRKYTANDITVHYKDGQAMYSMDSVFEVVDDIGSIYHLKNIKSIVRVKGSNMLFRNPPHFLNLDTPKLRDAEYETEAALDHYFKVSNLMFITHLSNTIYQHANTAPFIAHKLIQRFGISNPSPNYVRSVATAFRSGMFKSSGITFGSMKYGDLAATVAALLLNQEARSVVLDTDSSHGALREPLLKIISFMRSMEYKAIDDSPLIEFHEDTINRIGEMAHDIQSVFSFFLPNYQPAGPISIGTLVSPEAQLLTTPHTISSFWY